MSQKKIKIIASKQEKNLNWLDIIVIEKKSQNIFLHSLLEKKRKKKKVQELIALSGMN